MKFNKLRFLCDENIDPSVIVFLNENHIDAIGIKKLRLSGKSDELILKKSYKLKRVVITHDNDFGKIIYSGDIKMIGII